MIEDEPETDVQPDRTEPEAEQAPEPTTVTLRVDGPFYCTHFTMAHGDAGTLVIDRHGVEVPAEDAPGIIETAAQYGVTLRSDK